MSVICPPRSTSARVPEPLDVHMIYPFELNFSTLISAFYVAACDIIVENIARA